MILLISSPTFDVNLILFSTTNGTGKRRRNWLFLYIKHLIPIYYIMRLSVCIKWKWKKLKNERLHSISIQLSKRHQIWNESTLLFNPPTTSIAATNKQLNQHEQVSSKQREKSITRVHNTILNWGSYKSYKYFYHHRRLIEFYLLHNGYLISLKRSLLSFSRLLFIRWFSTFYTHKISRNKSEKVERETVSEWKWKNWMRERE